MEENRETDSHKEERGRSIASPSSIGFIIFLLVVILLILPTLFLLILIMTSFLGIWSIIVCYDIGKIKHNGTWNLADKSGIILSFIATLLLLPFPLALFDISINIPFIDLPPLHFIDYFLFFGLGFYFFAISLTLIAPLIMLTGGQSKLSSSLENALTLGILQSSLLVALMSMAKDTLILLWVLLFGISSLIIGLLISLDSTKQGEKNTTGDGENNGRIILIGNRWFRI